MLSLNNQNRTNASFSNTNFNGVILSIDGDDNLFDGKSIHTDNASKLLYKCNNNVSLIINGRPQKRLRKITRTSPARKCEISKTIGCQD